MRRAVKNKILDLQHAKGESDHLRMYLKNIFNSMPSTLVCIDRDSIVTQWNAHAQLVTGIKCGDALGQSLQILLPELNRFCSEIKESMNAREVYDEYKVPNIIPGKVRYGDLMVFPLVANGVVGAVVRIDDVSDQVQLETMMIQAEKMGSVAGLAAGMAHEINNPLAAISQGIQNITRRIDADSEKNIAIASELGISLSSMHKYLEQRKVLQLLDGGKAACRRAADIVRNMLRFSRRSDSKAEPFDLAVLVETVIDLGSTDYDLKKKYDFKFVEIVREYDDLLPPVMCCVTEIEQVLLNLLKNALQAMEEIGREDFKPLFHIRLIKEEEFARIEVEDNGPGMSDEIMKRIFEPFFTTKPVGSGTGLGLSVSYMIITQNHCGTMDVESEPGRGTKFIIRLPLSDHSS